MAIATYQRTIDAGQEPDRKAVSVVNVDGQAVEVSWWPSLLTQTDLLFAMSKADIQRYLEAEALFATGACADAVAVLTPLAAGAGDNRNWAQRWIDEHPAPAPATPAVDPLL